MGSSHSKRKGGLKSPEVTLTVGKSIFFLEPLGTNLLCGLSTSNPDISGDRTSGGHRIQRKRSSSCGDILENTCDGAVASNNLTGQWIPGANARNNVAPGSIRKPHTSSTTPNATFQKGSADHRTNIVDTQMTCSVGKSSDPARRTGHAYSHFYNKNTIERSREQTYEEGSHRREWPLYHNPNVEKYMARWDSGIELRSDRTTPDADSRSAADDDLRSSGNSGFGNQMEALNRKIRNMEEEIHSLKEHFHAQKVTNSTNTMGDTKSIIIPISYDYGVKRAMKMCGIDRNHKYVNDTPPVPPKIYKKALYNNTRKDITTNDINCNRKTGDVCPQERIYFSSQAGKFDEMPIKDAPPIPPKIYKKSLYNNTRKDIPTNDINCNRKTGDVRPQERIYFSSQTGKFDEMPSTTSNISVHDQIMNDSSSLRESGWNPKDTSVLNTIGSNVQKGRFANAAGPTIHRRDEPKNLANTSAPKDQSVQNIGAEHQTSKHHEYNQPQRWNHHNFLKPQNLSQRHTTNGNYVQRRAGQKVPYNSSIPPGYQERTVANTLNSTVVLSKNDCGARLQPRHYPNPSKTDDHQHERMQSETIVKQPFTGYYNNHNNTSRAHTDKSFRHLDFDKKSQSLPLDMRHNHQNHTPVLVPAHPRDTLMIAERQLRGHFPPNGRLSAGGEESQNHVINNTYLTTVNVVQDSNDSFSQSPRTEGSIYSVGSVTILNNMGK